MNKLQKSQISIKWFDPVLQALSFWIGYKEELYRHHLLNEGAIVSELTSLITAKIKKGETVKCEVNYKNLSKQISDKSRVDILIEKDNKPIIILEVKRYESGMKLINADLKKLANIKNLNSNLRVFLILVSQGKKPRKYVALNGESDKIYHPIKDSIYFSYAKRVCKSSSSFRSKSLISSNYAILIEVLKKKI